MHLERHVLFWLLAAAIFLLALKTLSPVLLPFVVGAAIAYFLNPVVDRMWNAGFPRGVSTVVLLVLATAALVGVFIFLLPPAIEQGRQLLAATPAEAERLKTVIETAAREQLGDRYPQVQEAVNKGIAGIADALPGSRDLDRASVVERWRRGLQFNFPAARDPPCRILLAARLAEDRRQG